MNANKIVKVCDFIIESGFLAIVFFIPIIFDFSALTYNMVDIYKAVAFRAILTVILLVYVAKIFIENKLSFRGGRKIFWLALALLASFFISSLLSLHPDQSFWGNFYRQQGFYNYFHYLLFFVLLILNLNRIKQIRRIIIAAIAAASLSSVYGLIQYFNLDPVRWLENAIDLERIFSSLGQPNFFGHYLVLVLPLTFYALLFMAKSFLARFFVGLSLLTELFCLALTYSRAAWLGFLASTIILMSVWLIYKRHKKAALGLFGFILIGAAVAVGLNIIKPAGQTGALANNLVNRMKTTFDLRAGGSNRMRLNYWRASLQIIKRAEPLRLAWGYGPETLISVFMKYYQPDWGIHEAFNSSPDRAHNWFFDQILALGVLGLAATISFYAYLIYRAGRFLFLKPKPEADGWLLIFLLASLTAYSVNNFFSFSLFTNSVYLFLILAMVWSVIHLGEKEKTVNLNLARFSKTLIGAALLAVSAVYLYFNNINQAKAEIYYIKVLKSIKLADCRGALNNLERVVSLSPNSDYYQEKYLALALNCFLSVKDKAVQADIRDNILFHIQALNDKSLYDTRISLARCYSAFGFYYDRAYYAEAEQVLAKLIFDYPNYIAAYEVLAKQRMGQEDYGGAIEIYKQALGVLPPLDSPGLNRPHRLKIESVLVSLYESIGQAYLKIKNYDSAGAYFKKALKLDPYRATLYKNIADIDYLQGRLDQAIVLNRRGLMLNPGDYHWPLSLSLLYRDKKDLKKAGEYLDQALKLAPENAELKKYQQELENNISNRKTQNSKP